MTSRLPRGTNLTGNKYGRLTVVGLLGKNKKKSYVWECKCECGSTIYRDASTLHCGRVKSCGCLVKLVNTRHGLSRSYIYTTWRQMLCRCYVPTNCNYKNYGARGITVCDRWRSSFKAFVFDMGHRPSPTHSLDRIDTLGNYTPENCRWATNKEQSNNKRNNVLLLFRDKMLSMQDVYKLSGTRTPLKTVYSRLRRGWPLNDALELPRYGHYGK